MGEYEKVEGMSVGQVVDKMLSGDNFYILGQDRTATLVEFDVYDLFGIYRILSNGWVYTRCEKPWWEGREGSVIMVKEYMSEIWIPIIFESYRVDTEYPFKSNEGLYYMNARPLTQSEKDAIITED